LNVELLALFIGEYKWVVGKTRVYIEHKREIECNIGCGWEDVGGGY